MTFVQQFPAEWPTFFDDLFPLVFIGPSGVDLVLRVLDTIDEEVVDRLFDRPFDQNERNTNIKNAMRVSAVQVRFQI